MKFWLFRSSQICGPTKITSLTLASFICRNSTLNPFPSSFTVQIKSSLLYKGDRIILFWSTRVLCWTFLTAGHTFLIGHIFLLQCGVIAYCLIHTGNSSTLWGGIIQKQQSPTDLLAPTKSLEQGSALIILFYSTNYEDSLKMCCSKCELPRASFNPLHWFQNSGSSCFHKWCNKIFLAENVTSLLMNRRKLNRIGNSLFLSCLNIKIPI